MDKVGKEGLVVINTNATPYDQSDDHYRSRVSPASDNDQRNAGYLELWNESGDIHSNHITVLAEDKNGHIWVGTDKGLVVYYQPNKIFTEEKPLAKSRITSYNVCYTKLLRNDQVLLDLKLFTRHRLQEIVDATQALFNVLQQKSEEHKRNNFV